MKWLILKILRIISLILYLYDVGSDIALAVSYGINGDNWYLGWTLTFIILPTLVVNFMSCNSYVEDEKDEDSRIIVCGKTALHFLFGTIYRHVQTIYHTLKENNIPKDKKLFSIEIVFIEALFEAVPQLILQLYIMITHTQVIRSEFSTGDYLGIAKRKTTEPRNQDDDFFHRLSDTSLLLQIFSVISSLLSISWGLTLFTRNMLTEDGDLEKMPWKGLVTHFFWRLFTISARVLAISLFAAVFTYWICFVTAVRWLIVAIILWCSSDEGLSSWNLCTKLSHSLFLIFAYFHFDIGRPARFIKYFVIELAENSVLVGLWAGFVDQDATKYYYHALIFEFSCSAVGFLLMLLYLYRIHRLDDGSRSSENLKEQHEMLA